MAPCTQADFANKFVGGGVLRGGSVQEEIWFVICPELLVSLLLCEQMGPTEAIVITGAQRFSEYEGYSSTFKWSGAFKDTAQRSEFSQVLRIMLSIHKCGVVVYFK